jgi:hypothetical protein
MSIRRGWACNLIIDITAEELPIPGWLCVVVCVFCCSQPGVALGCAQTVCAGQCKPVEVLRR